MTVSLSSSEAEALGLGARNAGGVYTKVTWNVDTWLQANGGSEQAFPGTAGVAAETVIQYRAGIPLFENSVIPDSFDENETGPLGARRQGANLDNNTGPSTRHGTDDIGNSGGKDPAEWAKHRRGKG